MKKHLLFLGLIVAVSGCCNVCETPGMRIQASSELFSSFPEEAQCRLAQGEVRVGDTAQMVYIALGEPCEVRTSESGAVQWVYGQPTYISEVIDPPPRQYQYAQDGTMEQYPRNYFNASRVVRTKTRYLPGIVVEIKDDKVVTLSELQS
jgi:outer membrane protein assembly factor BamE (lipoprotein component of BamABCDE complex)